MLDDLDNALWYLAVGDTTVGPVATELVVRGIEHRKVPPDSLVCLVGETAWRALGSVALFHSVVVRSYPPPMPDSAEARYWLEQGFQFPRAAALPQIQQLAENEEEALKTSPFASPEPFDVAESESDGGFVHDGELSEERPPDTSPSHELPASEHFPIAARSSASQLRAQVEAAASTDVTATPVVEPMQVQAVPEAPAAGVSARQADDTAPGLPSGVDLATAVSESSEVSQVQSASATRDASDTSVDAALPARRDVAESHVRPRQQSALDIDIEFDDSELPAIDWTRRFHSFFIVGDAVELPEETLLLASLSATTRDAFAHDEAMWNLALCLAFGSDHVARAAAERFYDSLGERSTARVDWMSRTLLSRGFMPSGIPAAAGARGMALLRAACPPHLVSEVERQVAS